MVAGGIYTKNPEKNSNKAPLVTVVTVVFNGISVLEETIKSVVGQSFDDMEYIIVDGSSTDGTLEIIKKYEDKIDYWQSEPDKGIYDAMNKGIALARGKYINFMNAGDCFVASDTVEKCAGYFSRSPDSIFFGKAIVESDGFYRLSFPLPLEGLKKGGVFYHQSVFCPTFLMRENPFSTEYRIASDYDFLLKMYLAKKDFSFMDEFVCMYEANGLSSNLERTMKEYCSVHEHYGLHADDMKYISSRKYKIIHGLKKLVPAFLLKKIMFSKKRGWMRKNELDSVIHN